MTEEEPRKYIEDLNKKYSVDGDDIHVSLSAAMGKKIKDIWGYFGDPLGGGVSYGISQIIFEDDSKVWVDGAHDWAFVYSGFPFDLGEYEYEDDE